MARGRGRGRGSWSAGRAIRTYRTDFLIRPAAAMLDRGRKVGPGVAPGEFGGCNVTDALAEKIDVSSSNGGAGAPGARGETGGVGRGGAVSRELQGRGGGRGGGDLHGPSGSDGDPAMRPAS